MRAPVFNSRSIKLLPINPAAPVTRIVWINDSCNTTAPFPLFLEPSPPPCYNKYEGGVAVKPKRTYKDSLFRDIFNNKNRLQSLYEALTGNHVAIRDIKITTLRGTFFDEEVFDMVSFKWDPEVAMQVRMEEAQERGEKLGEKRGERRGEKRGAMQATLTSIRSLMKKLHMTAVEAMDTLEIPATEREKYASQL